MKDPTDSPAKDLVKALTEYTDALDALLVALRRDEVPVDVARERSAEIEMAAGEALKAAVAPLVARLQSSV